MDSGHSAAGSPPMDPKYIPMPLEKQVAIIWAAVNGYLDSVPLERVKAFEDGYYPFIEKNYPDIFHVIRDSKTLDDATEAKLKEAVAKYKAEFMK